MIKIYCIEDCNSLKYVGSTERDLNIRLIEHRYDKKINKKKCSSKLLDLNNCKIIVLEECDNSKRKEKEEYWINKINCVNIYKLKYNETIHRNNDEYKIKQSNNSKIRREWILSWGGDPRNSNNLLQIKI